VCRIGDIGGVGRVRSVEREGNGGCWLWCGAGLGCV
jgi:hypothetical protein